MTAMMEIARGDMAELPASFNSFDAEVAVAEAVEVVLELDLVVLLGRTVVAGGMTLLAVITDEGAAVKVVIIIEEDRIGDVTGGDGGGGIKDGDGSGIGTSDEVTTGGTTDVRGGSGGGMEVKT